MNSFDRGRITKEGGFAVLLSNNTGATSVKGEVMETSTAVDNAVSQATGSALDPVGVIYNAGVADGDPVWVVVNGRCEVLADSGGFARHDRLITSATAGRADVSNSPAVAVHFQEIGHALEAAAGDALGFAMVHFL